MAKFPPPNVPFVEARNYGTKQKPTAIVLTLSSTTSEKGSALGIANRLHKSNAPLDSYHYIVDEATTYQGVPDNTAAYCSPYRAIDILICAQPVVDAQIWSTPTHAETFHRTAELVSQLALAYKIPVRYLDDEAQERWKKHKFLHRGGIILRVLGEWPSESFLRDVNTQMLMKSRSFRKEQTHDVQS